MTETRFYVPARLSTPPKPLLALKPLDATTWLRSLLSKVFHFLLVKRVKCSAILYSLPKQHNLVHRSSRLTVQFSGNRPLPSSKNPHFQDEARCTTFPVKMSFICMRMKNDLHIKGWASTLVLKQTHGGYYISLRMQLSLLKGTRRDGSISPHVRECGFQNPWKVC